MKRILWMFLTLALFMTGCQTESILEETESLETESAETTPGREDREIIEDYKNITPSGEHDVKLLFTNAGKADSILVQIDEKNYLIDTGTQASPPTIFPALDQMGVNNLDAVFFSHTDNDHVGGYQAISEKYPVSVCYTSTISAEWTKINNVIGETKRITLDPGAVVELSEGVYFQVLGPIRYNPDDNENSLVLRLEVNGVTALFTGDMKYNEETSLIHNKMPLDCDILKVGYHGREDATSTAFMKATTPKIAVISTDRMEDDDSAHKSIVNALEDMDAKVYITDETVLGVLVKIAKDGKISVTDLAPNEKAKDVRIDDVSKEDQTVILTNHEDEDVDLSGWYIISETGKEMFCFPDDSVLAAGDSAIVACIGYNGECDYLWEDKRVWHKSKDDRAILLDCFGNRVDMAESE